MTHLLLAPSSKKLYLYLSSPSGYSWSVLGRTLHLHSFPNLFIARQTKMLESFEPFFSIYCSQCHSTELKEACYNFTTLCLCQLTCSTKDDIFSTVQGVPCLVWFSASLQSYRWPILQLLWLRFCKPSWSSRPCVTNKSGVCNLFTPYVRQ